VTLDARARRAAGEFRDALDDAARADPERISAERFDRVRSARDRNRRLTAVAVATVLSIAAATLVGRALAPHERRAPANPAAPSGAIVFNENFVRGGSDFVRSFTVHPDGTGLTEIGPSGRTYCGDNDHPWSPDGTRILCQVFRPDLTTGTATVATDGSNYAEVSNAGLPASFGCAAWSPDGARLLCPYTSDFVYTIGADGRRLVRLTTVSAGEGPSGYANDGSRVYFTALDATQHRTLYSVMADGTGGLTPLSPRSVSVHDNFYFDGVSADSSPDGSRIVFAADVTSTRRALYVADADGGRRQRIEIPSGINPTSAQWAPDGTWIAFSADNASRNVSSLYVVHPDGDGLREVGSPPAGCSRFAPVWSPDGAALLFATQCSQGTNGNSTRLETTDLAGTHVWKVADLIGLTSYGWGPARG